MSETFPPLDDTAFITPDKQVAQLRIPPHSIESESSVLGGLLLDNNAWDRVGDVLAEDNFYRHEHKLIFTAISSMINAEKSGALPAPAPIPARLASIRSQPSSTATSELATPRLRLW